MLLMALSFHLHRNCRNIETSQVRNRKERMGRLAEVRLILSGCYSAVQLVVTPVCFTPVRMYCTISVHIARHSDGRKPGTTGIFSVPVVCNLPDYKSVQQVSEIHLSLFTFSSASCLRQTGFKRTLSLCSSCEREFKL